MMQAFLLPRTRTALALLLALIVAPALPLLAQEEGAAVEAAEEPPPPPEPDWAFELGLSYLATTGNSETSSGGVKALWTKDWDPWSLEAKGFFLRAEDEDEVTAERYGASLTGARSLTETLDLTAGWSGEHDRFSGIDIRHVLSAGIDWKMVDSDSWTLSSLASLTYTTEDFEDETLPSEDYLGALAGLDSKWTFSENANLKAKAVYFPNFDESEDYRMEGEIALTANLTNLFALQLAYEVRYDNRPASDFEKTDTATTASLVMKLPSLAAE